MSKVIDLLKEHSELKQRLKDIIGLVKENDIKNWGLKTIEYTLLMAESLNYIDDGPLAYIEEIFSIDKVYLFINIDELPYLLERKKYKRIVFYNRKAFEYFFFKAKPFIGESSYNLTAEFNLVKGVREYLIMPIIKKGNIISSLNFYNYTKGKFNEGFAADFIKDLSIKVGYILQHLNKLNMAEKKIEYLKKNSFYSQNPESIIFRNLDNINNSYTKIILKLDYNASKYNSLISSIDITEYLYNNLLELDNVDYVYAAFLDTIYLLTAEKIPKKIESTINLVKEKIDNYTNKNKINYKIYIED
ncbi:MAG: hypothetical protein SVN78_02015 [Deferribacterota bacterium]|nr:hypothetical protein [Deferribacterota bacterium]